MLSTSHRDENSWNARILSANSGYQVFSTPPPLHPPGSLLEEREPGHEATSTPGFEAISTVPVGSQVRWLGTLSGKCLTEITLMTQELWGQSMCNTPWVGGASPIVCSWGSSETDSMLPFSPTSRFTVGASQAIPCNLLQAQEVWS